MNRIFKRQKLIALLLTLTVAFGGLAGGHPTALAVTSVITDASNRSAEVPRLSEASLRVQAQSTEIGPHYLYLTEDEKTLYDSLADLLDKFVPYSSFDELYQKLMTKDLKYFPAAVQAGMLKEAVFSTDLRNKAAKDEMCNNTIQAYWYDHPRDLRRYLVGFSFRTINGMTYVGLYKKNSVDLYDYITWQNESEEVIAAIEGEIRKDPSYDKTVPAITVLLVHDYICSYVKYKNPKAEPNTAQHFADHCLYNPVVNDVGVCEGIALMNRAILTDFGIETFVLVSDTHAWNLVNIEGGYYEEDCTWDLGTYSWRDYVSYKYYNVTTQKIMELDPKGTHDRARYSTRMPLATSTNYDYDHMVALLANRTWYVNPGDDESNKEQKYTDDDRGDTEEYTEVYPTADKVRYGDFYFRLNEDGSADCIGCAKKKKTMDIGDYVVCELDGEELYYWIGSIDDNAFYGNKTVKKLILGQFLTSIGKKAFYNCKNLNNIIFTGAEYLAEIGSSAFKKIKNGARFTIVAGPEDYSWTKSALKYVGATKAKFTRVEPELVEDEDY